ncbi:OmpA family protein [Sutterella megalosphaeroides]|uniref:Membrane protein n=1 Tax=Sutterella megalosphaeroides TaxID=2494234 RepID=A0A2Z6IDZ4_9BURK|nr:OmpA family protein [Sutterella megalosphaeroides]BBF24150.1 membrane protein [Sutterella megalosphaeroides]
MKTSAKIGGVVAALMIAASGATFAAEQVNPYVHSTSGEIVKTGSGLCLRTGFWTPALAEALGVNGDGCACDADILDANACKVVEEPAPAKAAEKVTFSADMLFDYNRATLKPEGQAVLDDLVSRIAGVDIEVILSTGYADRIGSDKFNEKLSMQRAETVKGYLVSKGVDAALIQTEGKGESDPVVNCPNPSRKGQIKNFRELVKCLAPNRRAVVEVVGSRPAE